MIERPSAAETTPRTHEVTIPHLVVVHRCHSPGNEPACMRWPEPRHWLACLRSETGQRENRLWVFRVAATVGSHLALRVAPNARRGLQGSLTEVVWCGGKAAGPTYCPTRRLMPCRPSRHQIMLQPVTAPPPVLHSRVTNHLSILRY